MQKILLQNIKALILFLIIMIGVQAASAAWVNVPGSVVTGDAHTPLYTGPVDQIKAEAGTYGGLGVGTFFANLNSEFHGDVHIGGTLGASTFAPHITFLKFKDGTGIKRQLCVDRSDGKLMVSDMSDCSDLAAGQRGTGPSMQQGTRN